MNLFQTALTFLHQADAISEEIKTSLDGLGQRTNAELDDLETTLREVADDINDDDADESIASLNAVADLLDAIKAERAARPDPAELVASLWKRIQGDGADEDKKPRRVSAGEMNRAKPASARPRPNKQGPALVASSDLPGFQGGDPVDDFEQLGVAFQRKHEAMQRAGVGHAILASIDIRDRFPADRVLTGDPKHDEALIEAVTSPQAIIASGGICAPIEAAYDVEGISTDVRPLRDALARFNARTGGVRFVPPITLNDADVAAAVSLWPESLDASPGNTTKAIATLDCGDEQEVRVGAVVARVSAGNMLRRFNPSRFKQFVQEMMAFHARVAENDLYRQLQDASLTLTAGQTLGTARDVLAVLDRAVAGFKSRHRMATNATLRFFAPDWLRAQMRADLARQMPGDNTLAVADAEIDRFFAARNVNVTWLLDARQSLGLEVDGSALNGWPSTVSTILTHEGAFTFLDGGTLDLGLEIRDTSTNETNDAEAFIETFEAVAFRGHESDELILDVCPSGEASGLADTTGALCSTGS